MIWTEQKMALCGLAFVLWLKNFIWEALRQFGRSCQVMIMHQRLVAAKFCFSILGHVTGTCLFVISPHELFPVVTHEASPHQHALAKIFFLTSRDEFRLTWRQICPKIVLYDLNSSSAQETRTSLILFRPVFMIENKVLPLVEVKIWNVPTRFNVFLRTPKCFRPGVNKLQFTIFFYKNSVSWFDWKSQDIRYRSMTS